MAVVDTNLVPVLLGIRTDVDSDSSSTEDALHFLLIYRVILSYYKEVLIGDEAEKFVLFRPKISRVKLQTKTVFKKKRKQHVIGCFFCRSNVKGSSYLLIQSQSLTCGFFSLLSILTFPYKNFFTAQLGFQKVLFLSYHSSFQFRNLQIGKFLVCCRSTCYFPTIKCSILQHHMGKGLKMKVEEL